MCDGCGRIFARSMKDHKRAIRLGRTKAHCSLTCYRSKPPIPCAHCGELTTNPKYCSRSCAASVSGKLFPKRINSKTSRTCTKCGTSFVRTITHKSLSMCESCYGNWKHRGTDKSVKLGALMNAKSVKEKHPSWKASYVRVLNRQWNKHLLKLPCARCGYSLHIELAHIRPITSFPPSATLGEVNARSNNVQLCRNCHWEFDRKLFTLEDLPRIELGSTA